MLLKSGAGPNKATEDGMTPVHVAAKFGNLATLILLLEDGGDPLRKTKVSYFQCSFVYNLSSIPKKLSFVF